MVAGAEHRGGTRDRRPATPSRGGLEGRPYLFVACLLPFLSLVFDALRDDLTANPIEYLTHRTGWWALTLLMVSLAITPLRRIAKWNRIVRYRRMIGLFAFFYASLHLAIYVGLDLFFDFAYLLEDILERPYITVGFTAWLLLVPLAATSSAAAIRKLGRRWQRLHRLVYLCAALGVLHFFWLVKADRREPLIFAGILALLLALRLPFGRAKRTHGARPQSPSA